jgi:hypothetical protein
VVNTHPQKSTLSLPHSFQVQVLTFGNDPS